MNEKKDKIWLSKFAYTILVSLICLFAIQLATQQSKLNEVGRDLKNIEYLNAGSQRLVKLVALELGIGISDSYLDEAFHEFLSPHGDTSLNVLRDPETVRLAEEVLQNWTLLETLLFVDEPDKGDLYLASDNLYYRMTELMVTADTQSNDIQAMITQIEVGLLLLLLCLGIVILKNVLSVRTELKLNQSLMAVASLDAATGIYNRSKCQEILKSTSHAPSKKTAVIVFDLNDLKKTNDVFGHQAGDSLIFSFALALQKAVEVHREKPFIGRYGGDEFIVFYDGIELEEELTHFLKELRHIVVNMNEKETKFQISYAVGYAINKEHNTISTRELFEQADEIMYQHKVMIKSTAQELNHTVNHAESELRAEEIFTEMDLLHQEFIDKLSNEEEINRNISLERRKNGRVVFMLSAVACFMVFTIAAVNETSKTYVGGNILRLSDGSTAAPKDKRINSPWKNSSSASNLLFDTLFLADHTFKETNPLLASSYQMLNEGYTYEITLKNELYWSDGESLTVEDVIFSFEAFLLCNNVNTSLSAAISKIVGAEAWQNGESSSLEGVSSQGNVITIHLTSPYANFMTMMTQFAPLPKHKLEDVDPATLTSNIDFFANPVTCGMYQVGGLNDDGNIYLIQNPYYHDTKPKIEIVELISNYSPTEIDYYNTNNVSEMVDYRAIQGFVEYPVEIHFYRYFVYNLQGPAHSEEPSPIADIRVRQALVHALDRGSLLDTVYFNAGVPFYSGALSLPTGESYPYNPIKAVALLEEAQYDFDRPIRIGYYYSDAVSRIFLEKVADYYEKIGLTVELYKIVGNEQIYAERDYDLLLKGLSSFDSSDWYNEYLSSNNNLSQLLGKDRYFDELVYALGAATSQKESDDIKQELVELEKELFYKMPLFTLNQSVYMNETRLKLPDEIEFANSWYKYDKKFAEWEIIKK